MHERGEAAEIVEGDRNAMLAEPGDGFGNLESQAAGDLSGAADIDQMLQARARIRKVLDELDRLNGELSHLIIEG
ncbi:MULTISPECIES: hypothetical protein [Rhizobium]|uniref:hypothetical protein n=1 Tax=Rhizobium TaxID=379 RepID=UPI0007F0F315|nr:MULTISPECIES: hypothetical protein [Rhizobium]ANK95378.1 hypothetical protein AMK01_PD00499 [Rhizobium sp. N6212]ANL01431.1 hypothetical protein AMK00_PD00498 [Rhizobium sp. N621]ANL07554.1 hypothetical protein AMJ99_PD00500 [Rhizobium esperanzae]ANL13724.1 hypothetical protein AMJ98_PE00500 [Rhizobium sp. N1341]ANL25708.1 hypothetical protein AMJ96_PD00507 [Rhizobium sp. N113]